MQILAKLSGKSIVCIIALGIKPFEAATIVDCDGKLSLVPLSELEIIEPSIMQKLQDYNN